MRVIIETFGYAGYIFVAYQFSEHGVAQLQLFIELVEDDKGGGRKMSMIPLHHLLPLRGKGRYLLKAALSYLDRDREERVIVPQGIEPETVYQAIEVWKNSLLE